MSPAPASSLSTRLTRMNLLVSGAVLLLAASAFFSYDVFSFRHNLIQNLDVQAQIIGENSVSALTFNDQESATANLNGLRRSPDVVAAQLLGSDGSIFANYGTPDQSVSPLRPLAPPQIDRVWSSGIHVLVAHRIVFQGNSVGTIYIFASLSEIGQRARQYLLIVFVVLLFCMVAALVISANARRLIAQPIIALADTALRVSRDRDYSVRAENQADSKELATLASAFNTMLTQIQERDAALNQARDELEARVEARTAELRAANRDLEAFSYTVAHDLRGPLDAISGIVYLLSPNRPGADNEAIQPMLKQLRTSTAGMSALIDDLLNFSRATTTAVKSDPVNLSAIVREIAAELTHSDPMRHVEFMIADLPDIRADAGLMRIMLDNLIRNAWKYTSHHSRACIEFGAKHTLAPDQPEGKLVYFVRDDGAGFDPQRMEQLFQPFQRLHDKADFPGTGIGLATVQRILARQGGLIWAEGAIERGATFYFTVR